MLSTFQAGATAQGGGMNSGIRIPNGPCVYLFIASDETVEYVGFSRTLKRVFDRRHELRDAREDCAYIEIIPCATVEEAKSVECRMITTRNPRLNVRHITEVFDSSVVRSWDGGHCLRHPDRKAKRRGLCDACYQVLAVKVRTGITTWEIAVNANLALPAHIGKATH